MEYETITREFGNVIYVHAGPHTFTIDPDLATPTVVEAHFHGTSARARKSDVFGNQLGVGLGATVNAEFVTSPYSAGGASA